MGVAGPPRAGLRLELELLGFVLCLERVQRNAERAENGDYHPTAYGVDGHKKGTKPADMPVEQATKFEFVVNMNTAKQSGLTIPQKVLARADRVIK